MSSDPASFSRININEDQDGNENFDNDDDYRLALALSMQSSTNLSSSSSSSSASSPPLPPPIPLMPLPLPPPPPPPPLGPLGPPPRRDASGGLHRLRSLLSRSVFRECMILLLILAGYCAYIMFAVVVFAGLPIYISVDAYHVTPDAPWGDDISTSDDEYGDYDDCYYSGTYESRVLLLMGISGTIRLLCAGLRTMNFLFGCCPRFRDLIDTRALLVVEAGAFSLELGMLISIIVVYAQGVGCTDTVRADYEQRLNVSMTEYMRAHNCTSLDINNTKGNNYNSTSANACSSFITPLDTAYDPSRPGHYISNVPAWLSAVPIMREEELAIIVVYSSIIALMCMVVCVVSVIMSRDIEIPDVDVSRLFRSGGVGGGVAFANSFSLRRQLSDEQMDILRVIKFKPEEWDDADHCGCAICMSNYEVNDEVRVLGCNHRFHKDCVDGWIRSRHTCPLCRRRIGE